VGIRTIERCFSVLPRNPISIFSRRVAGSSALVEEEETVTAAEAMARRERRVMRLVALLGKQERARRRYELITFRVQRTVARMPAGDVSEARRRANGGGPGGSSGSRRETARGVDVWKAAASGYADL
jgi:hypothetical protein